MKIAITSDLHFYNWPSFSDNSRVFNSRNLEIAKVLNSIFDICKTTEVNHVFILGDVFHNKHKLDVDSLLLFKACLKSFPGHVHIIPGNHDLPFASETFSIVDVFESPYVHIYSRPQVLNLKGEKGETINFLLIPYLHQPAEYIEEIFNTQKDSVDYVFGHFGVRNATLINTDFKDKSSVNLSEHQDPRIKRIFLGHYHTPQKVPGFIPIYYAGSPLHHTFNDEGQEKRFLILNIEENSVINVPTKYPNFITCNFNSDSELEAYKFTDLDYYRIYVSNEVNPVKIKDVIKDNKVKYTLIYKNADKKVVHFSDKMLNENILIKKYLVRSEVSDKLDVYHIIRNLQNDLGTA